MSQVCSIFSQLLKLFPRAEFEQAVRQHRGERHARGFTCWGQFVAMLFCQLGRAQSLREICGGLAASQGKLRHLGLSAAPPRSTLAYANRQRPWQIYETVLQQLLAKCRGAAPGHKFRFKNKLLSLDASVIDLCASLFDWAQFRRTKGAVKLHLVLDHDGYLPSFCVVTDGKTPDLAPVRQMLFDPATIVVFSNCEQVRLFENGAVVATQKPDSGYLLAHPPFTFQARKMGTEQVLFNVVRAGADDFFEPSELQAEGLIGGAVVATHEVVAPGIPRRIDLKADYDGRPLVADGADWIRVYAHLVDDRGTVNPFATDLVTFSVEGEGCIIGDAAIGANPVSAEAGIATALLRATTTAGKILVGASAWGLVPGAVTIESGLAVAAQRSQETT